MASADFFPFHSLSEFELPTASTKTPLTLPDKKVKVIHLNEITPFAMGVEQGKLLSDEIRKLYQEVLPTYFCMISLNGQDPYIEAKKLEAYIPDRYIQEMKGIAVGANIPYDLVLLANTVQDIFANFACSIIATEKTEHNLNRLVATNHFPSDEKDMPLEDDSLYRSHQLQQFQFKKLDIHEYQRALKRVENQTTVQAIIFDPNQGSIDLATADSFAASHTFHHLTQEELFPNSSYLSTAKESQTILARNLDWPIPTLGSQTIVIVRPSTIDNERVATIGWPGHIGSFSGMNDKGLALASSTVMTRNQIGIPTCLALRQVLENNQNIESALHMIHALKCASSMNVVMADKKQITHYEISTL